MKRIAFTMLLAFFAAGASAHQPDQSYVYLQVREDGTRGRLELAAPLLEEKLGAFSPEITQNYAREILGFHANDAQIEFDLGAAYEAEFDELPYVVVPFSWRQNETPNRFELRFTPFFDLGKTHWGVCVLEQNYRNPRDVSPEAIDNIILTFDPTATSRTVALKSRSWPLQFTDFAKRGVAHFLHSKDHIFITLLLLVSLVLAREIKPKTAQRDALVQVALLMIGHTVSLTLAQLTAFQLPFWVSPIALLIFAALIWRRKAQFVLPVIGFLVGAEFAQPMSHLVTGT
ncbi:MAG: hypothetical protein AAF585_12155 [Verrucomicrobiota bacterium]